MARLIPDAANLDRQVLELGERLQAEIAGRKPGVFNAAYWEGRLMEWAMRDPAFKIDLLRFVDALQGWAILAAMVVVFVVMLAACGYFEQQGTPVRMRTGAGY